MTRRGLEVTLTRIDGIRGIKWGPKKHRHFGNGTLFMPVAGGSAVDGQVRRGVDHPDDRCDDDPGGNTIVWLGSFGLR